MVSTAKLRPEKGPLRQSLYLKVKLQFLKIVERPIKATLYCLWGVVGRVKSGFLYWGQNL